MPSRRAGSSENDDSPTDAGSETRGVVSRTLRALEYLAAEPQDEASLAKSLGVHTRTVQRLLAQMMADGWVKRTSAGDEYMVTFKIAGLAGQVLERTDVSRVAGDFVVQLRRKTGESAHLSVPGEDTAVHLINDLAEGVIVRSRFGELVSYHASAVGKVLLAYDVELCERVLRRPLDRHTEYTLVDAADLRAELSRVRQCGYAIDNRQDMLYMRCVAAPVFDHRGVNIAALGISAPAMRFTDERLDAALGDVTETAAQLSQTLGYVSPRINRGTA